MDAVKRIERLTKDLQKRYHFSEQEADLVRTFDNPYGNRVNTFKKRVGRQREARYNELKAGLLKAHPEYPPERIEREVIDDLVVEMGSLAGGWVVFRKVYPKKRTKR
jgi:hypothetical protein